MENERGWVTTHTGERHWFDFTASACGRVYLAGWSEGMWQRDAGEGACEACLAGHPQGEAMGCPGVAGEGLVSEGSAGEARRDTHRDTPPTTLQDTLFSPERHPRHPKTEISATHVPRRALMSCMRSTPSYSGEGVQGVSGVREVSPTPPARELFVGFEESMRVALAALDPILEELRAKHDSPIARLHREIVEKARREFDEALEVACALANSKGPSWGVRVSGPPLQYDIEVTRDVEGGTIELVPGPIDVG